MKTKITLAVLLVLMVLVGLGGVKALQIRKLMAGAENSVFPPESVSTAIVKETKWPNSITTIATVAAAQGVNVTTELDGTVKEIAFESGAVVARGDLLVRLDTTWEAAQLRALEAQVELARLNAERVRQLRAANTMSQAELDSAEATLKQHQATADAVRATIEKKTIRAPFPGRLGIRVVNLGEFLEKGKPIVSLQSLSPIHADFSLPQQELAQLTNALKVVLTTDAYADRQFQGAINAINPELNESTRSVRVQAMFDNADQLLRPGMFARVEVLLPSDQTVLVIPATSVLSAPFGDSVYVIESKPAGTNGPAGLVARQQFVRLGPARGDFVSVEAGLKPGEKVVSAGQFKLRNGMSVIENNELAPKASEKPRLSDS